MHRNSHTRIVDLLNIYSRKGSTRLGMQHDDKTATQQKEGNDPHLMGARREIAHVSLWINATLKPLITRVL